MYLETILPIIIFFFGSIIGSFLNVVILRFRSGRSIGGRSACMVCSKTLTPGELVPIGSFLSQRGRCTGCKTRISWQYPAVEALTGALFVLIYFRFAYLLPSSWLLFVVLFSYTAILVSTLIVLSVYDIRHKILPDKMVVIFASIALIGMVVLRGDAVVLHIPKLSQLLAGILLPAPFTFLWYVSKGKWMGLGDSKLMVGIGFLLGLSGGVTAILFAFWLGAIYSLLLIVLAPLFRKGSVTFKTAVPFGPFLALGTIIVLLGGYDLWSLVRLAIL